MRSDCVAMQHDISDIAGVAYHHSPVKSILQTLFTETLNYIKKRLIKPNIDLYRFLN